MVAKISIATSAVMMLLVMSFIPQNEAWFSPIKACYGTWSRCAGATIWFGGKLLNTCQKRCLCLGRANGKCVLRRFQCPLTKAYRCECSGRTGPKPFGCIF